MKFRELLGGFSRTKDAVALYEQARQAFARGENAVGAAALLKIGEDGDPEVSFQLGECYETAKGVMPNFGTAALWYEKAASRGHVGAQARLGDLYLFGRRGRADPGPGGADESSASRLRPRGMGVQQDFAKALYWNSLSAEAGSGEAQGRLAYQYALGLGVDADYMLAERWFSAAAEQGHGSGQFGLGMLYAGAYKGAADYVKAAYWFERAVIDNADTSSKYYLALLLKDGLGVPADPRRALELLSEAADNNHTEAIYRLGDLYRSGAAGEKNFVLAEMWLRRAGARGHTGALVSLAKLLVEDSAPPDYGSAAIVLREAADLGDGLAQYYLGEFYNAGRGVPHDPAEASIWFHKAADHGVIGAIESLGLMHATGIGQERDYSAALSLLRLAAERGSASAEFNIGNLYNHGLGIERNVEAAIDSYRRAAQRGSADACLRLGVLYATGDGVEQDYKAAADWYARAEQGGNIEGTSNLAFLYIRGLGVELDQKRGIRMLSTLADSGHLSAVWSLYHLFASGTYVPAQATEARRWLERAADMGSGVAAREFARQVEYAVPGAPSVDRALAWLTAAAEKGEAVAQEVLGRWYYEGKFVPRNDATALHWNSLAAEGGNPFAQAWMGDVLNQGLAGVIVDRAAARRWYEKAAEQRHTGALTLLTHIVFSEPVDQESLRKLFGLWLDVAEAGDSNAQMQVAGFYLEGTGVECSLPEAVKWLRAAAENGHTGAQVRLGGLLLQSEEAGRNPADAAALFQQAAIRGDVDGQYNLGVCYRLGLGVALDRERARSLYVGAAMKGHHSAQLALGDLLVEIGDEDALKEAVKWYEEASSAGLPHAFFGLAQLYETGKGVYPDRARAIQLNRRAAESGHAGAEAALARLTGVQSAA
jgi:hypothetical protein